MTNEEIISLKEFIGMTECSMKSFLAGIIEEKIQKLIVINIVAFLILIAMLGLHLITN